MSIGFCTSPTPWDWYSSIRLRPGPTSDKPRLLSDNGPSYIAGELAEWIGAQGMSHTPFHPQTQGKIERWHQTLKNRVLLENYFLPGDLERAFIEYYNHWRTLHSPGHG